MNNKNNTTLEMKKEMLPNNEAVLFERFKELDGAFAKMLPALRDSILALSPMTENKLLVTNAWTNFTQMESWLVRVMKEAFIKFEPFVKDQLPIKKTESE